MAKDYVNEERLDALPEPVKDALDYLGMQVPDSTVIQVREKDGYVLWDADTDPPLAALVDTDGNLRNLPVAMERNDPSQAPVDLYHKDVVRWLEAETARRARNN